MYAIEQYVVICWRGVGGCENCSYQSVKIVWVKINLLIVFINRNTNTLSQIILCDAGKPCGIDYEMKAYVGDTVEDKPHKRNSVRLAIRKVKQRGL